MNFSTHGASTRCRKTPDDRRLVLRLQRQQTPLRSRRTHPSRVRPTVDCPHQPQGRIATGPPNGSPQLDRSGRRWGAAACGSYRLTLSRCTGAGSSRVLSSLLRGGLQRSMQHKLAFPGAAQADRRLRDLSDYGWTIHTSTDDATRTADEQWFVRAGICGVESGSSHAGSDPRASQRRPPGDAGG